MKSPAIKKYFKDKGFTLIELIVVMAVFLFIIGAAIGIFLSVIENQKKVLAEEQLLNQISYTEEYMSKALRTAEQDSSGDCLGANNTGYIYLLTRYDTILQTFRGIKFLNQPDTDSSGNPVCQEFFIDNITPDGETPLSLNDSNNPLVLKELKNSVDDSKAVPLTPSSLQINFARFSVNGLNGSAVGQGCTGNHNQCGASRVDAGQPRVTMLLNVKIAGDDQEPNRTIQTTVSQRNLNAK